MRAVREIIQFAWRFPIFRRRLAIGVGVGLVVGGLWWVSGTWEMVAIIVFGLFKFAALLGLALPCVWINEGIKLLRHYDNPDFWPDLHPRVLSDYAYRHNRWDQNDEYYHGGRTPNLHARTRLCPTTEHGAHWGEGNS